jgi:hypothetical protein
MYCRREGFNGTVKIVSLAAHNYQIIRTIQLLGRDSRGRRQMKIAGLTLHHEATFRESNRALRPHQERDITSSGQKSRAKVSAHSSGADYEYPQDSSPL